MNKSKRHEQCEKTKNIFRELRFCSGKNWRELFVWLDSRLPGLVAGDSNMRHLGNGLRSLNDDELLSVSKLALSSGYSGKYLCAASTYIPPTDNEIDDKKKARRHEKYLADDPIEKVIHGPMRRAKEEKIRRVAELEETLAKLSPAGFSHAEILYMVYSWLVLNHPTSERGKRQAHLVLFREVFEGDPFQSPIIPESLPNNFVLPEHDEEMPYFIKCLVTT